MHARTGDIDRYRTDRKVETGARQRVGPPRRRCIDRSVGARAALREGQCRSPQARPDDETTARDRAPSRKGSY
ncbi:hypothetical protein NBRC3257_1795 [Gluconobacter thailandicus NBRC 3257]|uniref:Uncharacterized protein n=1 Tax=Gluconobacter thailandicus NBRC 3257 TaxID=1381097 RepID=A0ABQ0IX59_GLUTH|nr:hypothetical protein NBRC3255_3015 [Gluconobacter thailandicus NBRC 3255]GAD26795.1 hypothetical protein NBRC3257_1795 [Gluconobacter thailandicus NBRC 3257]